MLLLENFLLEPRISVLVSTLIAALSNIISSGDFRSVVLVHENRTGVIASEFLNRRPTDVHVVVLNIDSDSNALSKALKARGGVKRFLLVTLFEKPASILGTSQFSCKRPEYNTDANFLSIFIGEASHSSKEDVMKTWLNCSSNVGLLSWKGDQFRAYTSNLYRNAFLVPVDYGLHVSQLIAPHIFYEKHPQIAIAFEQNVVSLMIVDDANALARFMERKFGARTEPWTKKTSVLSKILNYSIPEKFM